MAIFTTAGTLFSDGARDLGGFPAVPFKLEFEIQQVSGAAGGETTLTVEVGDPLGTGDFIGVIFDAGAGPFLPATSALVPTTSSGGPGTPVTPFLAGNTFYLIALKYDGTTFIVSVDGIDVTAPLTPGVALSAMTNLYPQWENASVGANRWQIRNAVISPL